MCTSYPGQFATKRGQPQSGGSTEIRPVQDSWSLLSAYMEVLYLDSCIVIANTVTLHAGHEFSITWVEKGYLERQVVNTVKAASSYVQATYLRDKLWQCGAVMDERKEGAGVDGIYFLSIK
jgi:hypothetical protein